MATPTSLRMAMPEKPTLWRFGVIPRGLGTEDRSVNQSCLWNEASLETPASEAQLIPWLAIAMFIVTDAGMEPEAGSVGEGGP